MEHEAGAADRPERGEPVLQPQEGPSDQQICDKQESKPRKPELPYSDQITIPGLDFPEVLFVGFPET